MASPAYEQILQVQAFDLDLARLRHRRATHPLHDEVASATSEVGASEEIVAAIEARRHDLERDLKRLADEVELIEAKRTDIDGKLYDGSVTASKELLALQDEAAALLERQRAFEDDELEIMEQMEGLADEGQTASTALAAAQDRVATAQAALAEATAEIDDEIAGAEADRSAAAGPALPDLLARYEELAPQFDGVAVARLVDGRCDGCHMQLSAVAVDQLSKAAEDAVVTCEECGRLLVR